MDPRIQEIEDEYKRTDLPAFSPGDTIRVRVRVREGDKERVQAFEGVCISRRGSGVNETFTVRKVSGGVGVERIFPLHSPSIDGIEVTRRGQVRRAKLYYLRERRGKKARVKERSWWLDQQLEREGLAGAGPDASAGADAEEPTDEPAEEATGETNAGPGTAGEEVAEPEAEEEVRA